METRHIVWNAKTGTALAWIAEDGEIISAVNDFNLTREEVEELAKEFRAELHIN